MTSIFDNPDWKHAIQQRSVAQLCDEDFPAAMSNGRVTQAKAVIDALEMSGTQPSPQQIDNMAQQMAPLAFPAGKKSKWTDLKWFKLLDHFTDSSLSSMGVVWHPVGSTPTPQCNTTSYAPLLAAWCMAHPNGPQLLAHHIHYQKVGGATHGMVRRVFDTLLGQEGCEVEPIVQQFTPEQRTDLAKSLTPFPNVSGRAFSRILTPSNAQAFPEYKAELLSKIYQLLNPKKKGDDDPMKGVATIIKLMGAGGGFGNGAMVGIQQTMQNIVDQENEQRCKFMDAVLMTHQDIWDDHDLEQLTKRINKYGIQGNLPQTSAFLTAWNLNKQLSDQYEAAPSVKSKM